MRGISDEKKRSAGFRGSDADRREAEALAERERRGEDNRRRLRWRDALDAAGALMDLPDKLLA